MSQVSSRAVVSVLEVLTRWGVDVDTLVEGLPCPPEALRNVRERIDWDTFARLLERVSEALDHDDARLEALGAALLDAQSWSFVANLARRFAHPPALARAATLMGSFVFPILDFEQQHGDDGRLRFSLSIPPQCRAARPFFVITAGQWRAFPRLLGLPDAQVEADVGERHGRYLVVLPVGRRRRLRELAGAVLGTPAWLRTVSASRRDMHESFAAMERWRHDYHRVLHLLPDAVLIHREGVVLYGNATLAELLLETSDALVGRRVDHVVAWAAFQRARRACCDGSNDEARRVQMSGPSGDRTVELRHVQDVDFEGAPAELVVAQDVTERVQMEERLLHTDRMANLGSLAAGMAHEINNPLGYLLNSLQILQRDAAVLQVGGTVDASWLERLRAMLDVALEGTERVRTILDDLRTFVRRDDQAARPIDVRDAIEYSIELLGGELAGVRIERDFVSDGLVIASPPARLSQVVLNLVLNAVQAVRGLDGGSVTLRTRRDGEKAVVEIVDDGPGMTAEVKAQAFEPFFTTKPAGVGTGLGLPICRELVHRLGGDMTLTSEPGRGTCVRLSLPLVEQEVQGPSAA